MERGAQQAAMMEVMRYALEHMTSKELVYAFYREHNINFRKTDSYARLAQRLDEGEDPGFSLDDLRKFLRNHWQPCPSDAIMENLKSGKLQGHDWHGAMPSMLHYSLQDKVRECLAGQRSLDELLKIGTDIMRHEYFMVVAHDLLETSIIEHFETAIPPTRSKSISDFIYQNIPYDLKNTNYVEGWTKERISNDKAGMAKALYSGADVARLRKQGQKTRNGWGLNRFYVLVEEMGRWLEDPEGIVAEVLEETKRLGDPVLVEIDELKIQAQVIAI